MASNPTQNYITFDEYLTHWAGDRPDGIALVEGDRTTTYAEADRITRQLIAFLQSHGIGKGDRIAWLGKNADHYLLLLYAAGRMGAGMAPVGWRLAPPEIAYILGDTGARLLVAAQDFLDFVATHPGTPLTAGELVWAQAWFRDPPAPSSTNLSNGIQWTMDL